YPQHEDFGLIAVEAQAAGRPVIAFGAGGVRDTVRPLLDKPSDERNRNDGFGVDASNPISAPLGGPTGIFFHEPTPQSLAVAIERFEKAETRFDASNIRRWAERFSPSRFDRAFDREIDRNNSLPALHSRKSRVAHTGQSKASRGQKLVSPGDE
ncbi:MAG: glycosyltransferase, partial [Planctomycetes bacterium]|nr:glycosyltransferase [Planctomycetota bacterium]